MNQKLKVMKKLLLILISMVAFGATAQDNPKYLNVLAVNGLNMRSQPDSKARVVTKVQYGKRVEVMQKTKIELQLGWVKDHWYKVKYRGREGFIFGGYLSTLQAPEDPTNVKLLADLLPTYCAANFKLDGQQINTAEAGKTGDTLFHSLLKFTNGAELEIENVHDRRTTMLLLKESVQSVYVLLEALLKQSGNTELLYDLRFVRGKDGTITRITNVERTISLRKFSENLTELKLTSYKTEN